MDLKVIFAAAFSLLFCSGCATSDYLSGKAADDYAESFKLSSATGAALNWGEKEFSAETAIVKAAGNTELERQVLLGLLNVSDTACEKYMAGMITSSNSIKSALSVSALGLSSAASLSSPTRSANILSGIASFATGTDQQLSNTVLAGKSTALIYKAVGAIRKKERSKILSIYATGGYVLASAELADYHAQCGPTVGINALEESVDKADTAASKEGTREGLAVALQYKAASVAAPQ